MKVTLIQKWNATLKKFKPSRMAALRQKRVIMDKILSLSLDVTEADAFPVICAIYMLLSSRRSISLIYKR